MSTARFRIQVSPFFLTEFLPFRCSFTSLDAADAACVFSKMNLNLKLKSSTCELVEHSASLTSSYIFALDLFILSGSQQFDQKTISEFQLSFYSNRRFENNPSVQPASLQNFVRFGRTGSQS